jgi:Flp pilus assembly protein TadG
MPENPYLRHSLRFAAIAIGISLKCRQYQCRSNFSEVANGLITKLPGFTCIFVPDGKSCSAFIGDGLMSLDACGRECISRIAAFRRSTKANIAMIVALSFIPMAVAAGGAVDMTRAVLVRTQIAEALDGAGLAVGSTPGLTTNQMQNLAQQYFTANYRLESSYGTPGPVQVSTGVGSNGGSTINVSDSVTMPTIMMKLAGIGSVNVNYTSQITWGQTKLWVSLVLDNTGSMNQKDSTGLSKISALITAVNQMLTALQSAAANPGDVQVALIPFSKNVNLGTSQAGASWIDWTDFDSAPPNSTPSALVGPGSTCPYSTGKNGFGCTGGPANGSSGTARIPSSGPYSGFVCPGVYSVADNSGQLDHYYNGCYNSVLANPNCRVSCTYTHTWLPNAHSTWDGCVMDRSQDYDVSNTTPGGTPTDFPAENNISCVPAALMGLNYNWSELASEVDSMAANGSTDQPVGLAWGWQAQTQGNPLNAPALPAGTSQIVIIVSDGLNTQDRWYGDGSDQSSQVDTREADVCTNMKAAGIIVYAVYVDLNGTQGNSAPLQNCASDSSKYFDLTTSGEIITTLSQITTQITQVRVSQ